MDLWWKQYQKAQNFGDEIAEILTLRHISYINHRIARRAFLALPELQPWLIELYDVCSEGKLQALLISHHPELINYLLASPIDYWFERQNNAPVRVKRISSEVADNSGLPIAELIARGWLNESA